MKKKIIAILMIAAMTLSMTACAKENEDKKEEQFADKNFISDLQKGLQARWDIKDPTDDSAEEIKKSYTLSVESELKIISKYKNEKFEDSKLQELAIKYINCLKSQNEALEYISVDIAKFNELWDPAYEARSQLIATFHNDYSLAVDDKYKDTLNEFLTTSKLVTDEANTKEIVESWIKSFNFTCVSDEYGYKQYESLVENTTGLNFNYVNLSINLIDSNGVTVETTYSSFNNISNGSKIKFEFSTDKDFASTEITGDYLIAQ